MHSKPNKVYNPAMRNVRESRNVIFIETPSAMPRPVVSWDFAFDDDDDMVRDARNYTLNQDISSPSPDPVVRNPLLRDLLEQVRETTDHDLGVSSAGFTR